MRRITYICNRCRTEVPPDAVIKWNLGEQRGTNPVEKRTFDFCPSCFAHVKCAFLGAMTIGKDGILETEKKEAPAIKKMENQGRESAGTSVPETNGTGSKEPENAGGVKMGALSFEEKQEILRLYVEEDLLPDDIAARLNRLPRGIKRTINSAKLSGELDRLRKEFEKKKEDEKEEPGTEPESDSYVSAPETELVNGRMRDVGGILALKKAGWKDEDIAAEKHCDVEVVRIILEKYKI